MSFRIHSTPLQSSAPCMIRVKHHQLPKELALAKLEAELEEEYEYEEESEPVPKDVHPAAVPTASVSSPVQQVPLPPVIGSPQPPVQVEQPAVDETFKLRRKRRV